MRLRDLFFRQPTRVGATRTAPAERAEDAKRRGNDFMAQRDFAQAAACYEEALRLVPAFPEALNNLGLACLEMEQYEKAQSLLEQALAQKASLKEAHFNLALISQQACLWAGRERHIGEVLARIRDDNGRPLPPFSLLAVPEFTPADLLRANRNWARRFMPPSVSQRSARDRHGRLRIGYLSADFHEHATTQLLAGVLEMHDRERFDIHAYSIGPDRDDAARARVRRACHVFRDFRLLDDAAAADRIAADEVDVLVDLKGYTQDSRPMINALRPAPVIVNWLGYPCTMGERRLADYVIGDPTVTPPEHAADFSETLALMPHCYQPNDHLRAIGGPVTRAEEGLPADALVFCCFNQAYKITPSAFDVWCRILTAVPGSVLWLMEAGGIAIANLRREAEARGVAASRLIFAKHKPAKEHLARIRLADIALDTSPYCSHTTASDALWAGVPLVTMIGSTFASRVAASLLNAVNLPELIATDAASYLRIVLHLARQPGKLDRVRARLSAQRLQAPLFDTERFTRALEALYAAIWQHARDGSQGPVAT